eukprot:CAMPEP_0117654112 /NCGR_PEP_ID=MMETSP0804-20121206/3565_1 /TAXON_ID=1074897 /ORGANISM="Tetraselmis astigmatica, Strain CCMP880" /LENGTH=195 /DNA_ID=CAMNT_0005460361 /DNA_START=220 /DNA_END=807 /DNA_ORIENTATION=-
MSTPAKDANHHLDTAISPRGSASEINHGRRKGTRPKGFQTPHGAGRHPSYVSDGFLSPLTSRNMQELKAPSKSSGVLAGRRWTVDARWSSVSAVLEDNVYVSTGDLPGLQSESNAGNGVGRTAPSSPTSVLRTSTTTSPARRPKSVFKQGESLTDFAESYFRLGKQSPSETARSFAAQHLQADIQLAMRLGTIKV